MTGDRAAQTRANWLSTIEKYKHDADSPGSEDYWSPSLDCASRDQLVAIQNDKLAALTPYLYENSDFYRRRFDRLGIAPTDIQIVDDLPKWPVVDKSEMIEDVTENPPYGTFCAIDDAIWKQRGWMLFSSSGSTGAPRVFRYTQNDRELWSWLHPE
jgi:phenylacetate-CoA ligase